MNEENQIGYYAVIPSTVLFNYGVIVPVIVRPKENGTYEMISGHRRKRACELAGIKQIKIFYKQLFTNTK